MPKTMTLVIFYVPDLFLQVRLILLPSKKQKHKTKIRSGDNPQYMESFLLHRVNPGACTEILFLYL